MTAVPLIGPVGGFPAEWQAHADWQWNAQTPPVDPLDRYTRITAVRGWASCACGFESTPRDDDRILPLPYAEAVQAYLDHLPPGMAAWLSKRYTAPRTDGERVERLRKLVALCDTDGATSLSVELVKEALGWYA